VRCFFAAGSVSENYTAMPHSFMLRPLSFNKLPNSQVVRKLRIRACLQSGRAGQQRCADEEEEQLEQGAMLELLERSTPLPTFAEMLARPSQTTAIHQKTAVAASASGCRSSTIMSRLRPIGKAT
jgi:hypothetical protein